MVPLRRRVLVLFAVGVLAFAVGAVAAQARFVTIDVSGASATAAFDISPSGMIVGAYDDATGEHGFIMRKGAVVETIDYPGAAWTHILGINARGDIVGQYGAANNTVHGFVRWNGSSDLTPIDIPQPVDSNNFANSMPWKISAKRTIVGCYHQSTLDKKGRMVTLNPTMHGWVMTAEGLTTYQPGGTMHTGVNPEDVIIGNLVTSSSVTTYVIDGDHIESFSYPGALVTRGYAIAPNGDIVGFYRDTLGTFHGFLRHAGVISSIDPPGATFTQAYGINPQGDVLGLYVDGEGNEHGFLLTKRGN